MNDDPNKVSTPAHTSPASSEDQQAIIDYLASETYAHRQRYTERQPLRRARPNSVVWLFPDSSSASLAIGLLGLGGLVIVFGGLMPVGMEVTELFVNTRPTFVVMTIVIQTIAVPPVIAFSFATVTPMFWYGSVVLRFLFGILCVTPGCIAFYISFALLEHGAPDDFLLAFAGVMFAQFLTAGTVALIVQMWSRWTLTHARNPDVPLPPLGTRAMMELTFIAAISCAVFMSVDKYEIMEGLLFFTAAGLVTSLAVIAALIALLREQRSPLALVIAGIGAFATAFLFAGFIAVAEFGWESILYNLILVSIVSLYGGALIYVIMWLCIWWLRRSGWRCINRDEEKQARARTDSGEKGVRYQ